jgi:hypothetical protein
MSIKVVFASIGVIGVLVSSTKGEPVPAFDAQSLLATSTHVAVVLVSSDEVLSKGLRITSTTSVGVTVKRRIRGTDLPGNLDIGMVQTYRPFDGGAPLRRGVTLLAFLMRAGETGEWQLADPYYGLFRVSSTRAGAGPADNLRKAVLAELRKSLDSSDGRVLQAALKALAAFRDRAAIEQGVALSHHDDVRVVRQALMYRFAVGDNTGFQQAVRLIEKKTTLTKGERDLLAWSLAGEKAEIPIGNLNRLLVSANYPTLRRVAATILSQRGDKTSIDALVAGLADADVETQYRCVVGLCRITGQSGPGYKEFMGNPTPTLQEWHAWSRGRRDR